MKAFERRIAVTGLEIRDNDGGYSLTGYASTFSQPYDMGWYQETVDPGAFKRTLGQKPDVRLLVNHDGLPLARTASGTLTLDTDKRGLLVSASLDPSDPDVASLVPKMRRGDLNQMSFAFRTTEDIWQDDMSRRTLLALDLQDGDVSVVTYPANPNASAAIRAGGANVDAIRSGLRCLEQRDAAPAEIAEFLLRVRAAYLDGEVPDLTALAGTETLPPVVDEAAKEAESAQRARQQAAAALIGGLRKSA